MGSRCRSATSRHRKSTTKRERAARRRIAPPSRRRPRCAAVEPTEQKLITAVRASIAVREASMAVAVEPIEQKPITAVLLSCFLPTNRGVASSSITVGVTIALTMPPLLLWTVTLWPSSHISSIRLFTFISEFMVLPFKLEA
ncbi:hypothetical protein Ahy_B08g090240 isoform A [Arachis hypogaea]|uniref:Uncharacterized protein n=1 Tax=Arachis hypogaea TaxID=3818 RepID=A0A444XZT6_ARAHY|nr:hypothetical protein Ahy_B08g090240 isoform A [Arachis hypogaea]